MSLSWIRMMLLSGNDEQFGTGMYFFRKIAKWHNLRVFTQKCWQIFAGGREREVRIQKNTIFYHLVLPLTPPIPQKTETICWQLSVKLSVSFASLGTQKSGLHWPPLGSHASGWQCWKASSMREDGQYCLGGGSNQAPGPVPMDGLSSINSSRTGLSTCFLQAWFQGLKYIACQCMTKPTTIL